MRGSPDKPASIPRTVHQISLDEKHADGSSVGLHPNPLSRYSIVKRRDVSDVLKMPETITRVTLQECAVATAVAKPGENVIPGLAAVPERYYFWMRSQTLAMIATHMGSCDGIVSRMTHPNQVHWVSLFCIMYHHGGLYIPTSMILAAPDALKTVRALVDTQTAEKKNAGSVRKTKKYPHPERCLTILTRNDRSDIAFIQCPARHPFWMQCLGEVWKLLDRVTSSKPARLPASIDLGLPFMRRVLKTYYPTDAINMPVCLFGCDAQLRQLEASGTIVVADNHNMSAVIPKDTPTVEDRWVIRNSDLRHDMPRSAAQVKELDKGSPPAGSATTETKKQPGDQPDPKKVAWLKQFEKPRAGGNVPDLWKSKMQNGRGHDARWLNYQLSEYIDHPQHYDGGVDAAMFDSYPSEKRSFTSAAVATNAAQWRRIHHMQMQQQQWSGRFHEVD